MKLYRFVEKFLVLGLLCFCSWTSVMAQQSGSAASVSRTCAIVNAGPNAEHVGCCGRDSCGASKAREAG